MSNYKVNANGDKVCIILPVINNSSDRDATGVLLTVDIPAGLSVISEYGNPSIPVGTWDTNEWSVGNVSKKSSGSINSYFGRLCLVVTNINAAPFTITRTLTLNENDIILPNNVATDVISKDFGAPCEPVPQIQIGPRDDLNMCPCHNVLKNDVTCGLGYTTIIEIVDGSLVNGTVITDIYKGEIKFKHDNPTAFGQYKYHLRCIDTVTGEVSDPYGPATVTVLPLYTSSPSAVPTNVTYTELATLIANSTLGPGLKYKITDRGDRGIIVTALSNNTLSINGDRIMLVPKTYKVISLDGNAWKGVWHITKTAAINNLFIWGGKVWKNLTGAIGTATNDILLDGTNWAVVPKNAFASNEYIEKNFSVTYDFATDWISSQRDSNDNEFGISLEAYQESGVLLANPVDISDWNYLQDDTTDNIFANNRLVGAWNNVEGARIFGNGFYGVIVNNKLTTSGIITGNICIPMVTTVFSRISDNSCGSIATNYVNDGIMGNSGTGFIKMNRNNGFISNNVLGAFNIVSNVNNGNISAITLSADVTDTVVDK